MYFVLYIYIYKNRNIRIEDKEESKCNLFLNKCLLVVKHKATFLKKALETLKISIYIYYIHIHTYTYYVHIMYYIPITYIYVYYIYTKQYALLVITTMDL